MAGHPQAAKLRLTSSLPRSPGVYLFCGHRDEVLYVGKATNLRQRVRSYFGREDRRRIGPMLREAQAVRHHCLPDPLSAEVVEARLIARLKPRYNRAGTRADRYCYVRLDVDSAWPRLAIVRDAARTGVHLGPLPSRTMADARRRGAAGGVAVAPLLGAARPHPRPAGGRDAVRGGPDGRRRLPVRRRRPTGARYDDAVGAAVAAMTGVRRRGGRATRRADAHPGRRAALRGGGADPRPDVGPRRRRQPHPADGRPAGRGRFETTRGDVTWVVDHARLVDVRVAGSTAGALPAAPPPAPEPGRPLPRLLADEALVLARRLPLPDATTSAA